MHCLSLVCGLSAKTFRKMAISRAKLRRLKVSFLFTIMHFLYTVQHREILMNVILINVILINVILRIVISVNVFLIRISPFCCVFKLMFLIK